MTLYGGFDPGTFQAWSLNLFNSIFVKAGIARGFQITPTSPASMAVQNTLDSTALDAVVFLSNGAFLRVDAVMQFSISANSSGSTRTDALVAQVDPTNSTNLSLAVQANWGTGFTPANNNQFVIALISVANGASSIVAGNITMNSALAQVTGAAGATQLQATDGVSLVAQDSSASSTFSLVLTNLTTGVGRAVAVQATDTSSLGHVYTFGTDGYFVAPTGLRGQTWSLDPSALNGETPNSVTMTALSSAGGLGKVDVFLHNPTGGWTKFSMANGTGWVDNQGIFTQAYSTQYATNASQVQGHVVTVGFTQPSNPSKYDVWIQTKSTF